MAKHEGAFLWYELLTADPAAAERFYADVVGWSVAPYPGAEVGGEPYRVVSAPDCGIGGIARPPAPGMPPMWLAYIGVADVDEGMKAVEAAGGQVRMGPMDLPEVGRIALVADPGGIPFYLMTPTPREGGATTAAFEREGVGHCGWNELAAADLDRDRNFYLGLFGWTVNGGMPMGDMGTYEFLERDGGQLGAAMQNPPGRGPAHWTFYFRVSSIEAAKDRVEAAGGTVLFGPTEVPGGEWIVQGVDPQGAGFALVGRKE